MILALLAVIVIYDDLMVTDDSKLYKCIVSSKCGQVFKNIIKLQIKFRYL